MKEALAYLEQVRPLGSVLGLESIKEVLRRLEHPEKKLKVVHIAGTNGKGSIMTFLQNILIEAGYLVGRYSSPAVFEFREMFQLGRDYISEEEFSKLLFQVKEVCDGMVRDGLPHPTEFEIETAVALLFFANHHCDVALIECGMGGETDATNVFEKNLCSILSTISLDHMKFLGDTVSDIANVKAGIIKEGCPVVSSQQETAVTDTIKKAAKDKQSAFVQAGVANYENETEAFTSAVSYQSTKGNRYSFSMSMRGNYQLKNVATAIEVAEILQNEGFDVERFIVKGIEASRWNGRMEKVWEDPLIILDGAHNPGAVKELKETIDLYFTNQRITFIMGVLADKDFEEEAKMIAPRATSIFTVTPKNPRALDAKELAKTLRKYQSQVQSTNSLEEALKRAKEEVQSGRADMILAFGSLSYLGELKSIITNS